MTPDALEEMLQAWGRAYGAPIYREEYGENERAPDIHPLAVAMRFAPGTREEAVSRYAVRGGQERRRLMAGGLEACGVRMIPADYVDPVPGSRSSNSGGHSPRAIQPVVDAVQKAWLALQEWWPLRAEVVRLQYQVRGQTQAEKAAQIGDGKEGSDLITVKRYRDELAAAKVWLHARLAK